MIECRLNQDFAKYLGYDAIQVKPTEILQPAKYSYDEACRINGMSPTPIAYFVEIVE